MNKRTPAVLLFCACASLLGTAQAAGTLIGQVGVQMVIGAGCTIINGSVSGGINQWGTLDFGSHSDLTNVVDAQTVGTSGNIQIQCSTGLTPSLTVNAGLHASGGQRYMQNTTTTSSTIAYNIYSDAARSALIQANTPVDISSVSTGTAVNIPSTAAWCPPGKARPRRRRGPTPTPCWSLSPGKTRRQARRRAAWSWGTDEPEPLPRRRTALPARLQPGKRADRHHRPERHAAPGLRSG